MVAYNISRARRAKGWSQDEFARRLETFTGRRWSNASVSAAERSWESDRIRKFDANELVSFALILGVPVYYLLLPPYRDGDPEVTLRTSNPGDQAEDWRELTSAELIDAIDPTQPASLLDELDAASMKHRGGRVFTTEPVHVAAENVRFAYVDEDEESDEVAPPEVARALLGDGPLPDVLRRAAELLESLRLVTGNRNEGGERGGDQEDHAEER
ncbi:helix-turn-helix transcriptional regulator [Streptomyces sp. NPDC085995]|uniref:helix-turn-helix domain-containing protein n=1 Tax=Streptomyces sp. NPDC085995 TaxID=3154861 RepID=UPI003418EFCB